MNLPSIPLGPRGKKALEIAGYIVLGLVVFVYGVHLSFPYKRAAERGKDALRSKYTVTFKDVERGWLPGDFTLEGVQLTSRPTKADETPKVITIDSVAVDVNILSMLSGSADVDIDAKVGAGRIAGTVTVGKDRLQASLDSRNLPLSDVPGLSSVIGMPMGGPANVTARLDLPRGDWRQAKARIGIDCPGCTVGGPGAFFKPRTTRTATEGFVGKGVPVPLLQITSLKAEWLIEGGKIRTNRFEFLSPHLTVELDFAASVEKELKRSRVEGACLRYRGSEELKALDNDFYNALELTGGPLVASDNLRHLKLVGTLGNFKALGKECGGSDSGATEPTAGGEPTPRARPNLSDVPTEPAETGNGANAGTGATPSDVTSAVPPDAQPTPQPNDVQVRPTPDVEGPPPPEGEVTNGQNGNQPPPDQPVEVPEQPGGSMEDGEQPNVPPNVPDDPDVRGAEPPPPTDGVQSVPIQPIENE